MLQKSVQRVVLLLSLLVLVAMATPALAGGPDIVGSWEVDVVFDGTGATETILETYGEKGTFIASGPSASSGNGHGAWEKSGPRTYSTSQVIFGWAPDGSLGAIVRANAEVEVSQDGQTYTGTFSATVEVVGGSTLNNSGTVSGSRIAVE